MQKGEMTFIVNPEKPEAKKRFRDFLIKIKKSKIISFFLLFLLLETFTAGYSVQQNQNAREKVSTALAYGYTISSPYTPKTYKYKGQLHDHTNKSDGGSSPLDVVTSYKNAGYDFISITDHLVDYNDPNHPEKCLSITANPGVSGILFIPGAEQSVVGGHIGRIKALTSQPLQGAPAQDVINKINQEGGIAILNHPYWPKPNGTWTTAKIDALSGYNGIEIHNSLLLNDGTGLAEDRWDYVLSQNTKVWGFATDDCHGLTSQYCQTAYIRVFANNLTASEIISNIKNGNFHSGYTPRGSTDILLTVSTSGNTITAVSNVAATIEFIASGGVIKKTDINKTSSSYTPIGDEKYIRIRVTNGQVKTWSNPLFITQTTSTPTSTPISTPTPSPTPANGLGFYTFIPPTTNTGKTIQQLCQSKGSGWNCISGCPYPAGSGSENNQAYLCTNCEPGWNTADTDCNYQVPQIATSLSACCYKELTSPTPTPTPTPLKPGDVNGDGIVNIQDYQILSNSFAKSQGDNGYDVRADLNFDNTINVQDYQILSNNF